MATLNQTAAAKRAATLSNVIPYTPAQLAAARGPGMLQQALKLLDAAYLAGTVTHQGDTMPAGHKKKMLHPFGATAAVVWQPGVGHGYTGFFQHGGLGILRLSMGVAAWRKEFVPGAALKLFADNQPSVDLVAVESLDPMPHANLNFFAATLRTRVPAPWMLSRGYLLYNLSQNAMKRSPTPANVVSQPSALHLPLSAVAGRNPDGTVPKLVRSPIELRLRPNVHLAAWWTTQGTKPDFRTILGRIPPGTVLYDLVAVRRESWVPDRLVEVGSLVLETPFEASQYGDEQLFFRHDMHDIG